MRHLKLWYSRIASIYSVFNATTLSTTKTPQTDPLVQIGQGTHTTYIEGKRND